MDQYWLHRSVQRAAVDDLLVHLHLLRSGSYKLIRLNPGQLLFDFHRRIQHAQFLIRFAHVIIRILDKRGETLPIRRTQALDIIEREASALGADLYSLQVAMPGLLLHR